MTPKHDIIGIEQNGEISDAIDVIISSGLSKIVQFENCLLYTSPSPRDRG